jgi:hypothetical protein
MMNRVMGEANEILAILVASAKQSTRVAVDLFIVHRSSFIVNLKRRRR